MPVTLSLTESQVCAALRSVLLGILPVGTEVVRGQDNRVPEPVGPDFVVYWPISGVRLSTNIGSYGLDPFPTTRQIRVGTQVTIQLDVHGPNSADNAEIISTLLRDDYACQLFDATGLAVQTLYADDPRQMPFFNGEQQTEDRWIVEAVLQANPVTTVNQDFADTLHITAISVDAFVAPSNVPFVYDQDGNFVFDETGSAIIA